MGLRYTPTPNVIPTYTQSTANLKDLPDIDVVVDVLFTPGLKRRYCNGNLFWLYHAMFFSHNFLFLDYVTFTHQFYFHTSMNYIYPEYPEIKQILNLSNGYKSIRGIMNPKQVHNCSIENMYPITMNDLDL